MTRLDVHIYEIPADNINELDKIRKRLFVRPLQLKDYNAFNANSFMVRFGQVDIWQQVNNWLIEAFSWKIPATAPCSGSASDSLLNRPA